MGDAGSAAVFGDDIGLGSQVRDPLSHPKRLETWSEEIFMMYFWLFLF
jgi:hypothetical protein